MESQNQPANYPGIVDKKEVDSLNNILKELNIEESNSPSAPTKPLRYTSFGGRVRIDALTSPGAEKWIGKTINVGGWVKSLREGGGKSFCFLDLNDGSTVKNFQIVVDKEVENFNDLLKEGIGSCIQLRGEIVKSPGNKQPIEMKVEKKEDNYVKILGTCEQGKYPLMTGKEAKKMKLETLRDICHLRPRTNVISCVTRIRNNLAYATHIYFQNRGFLYIQTPEIISSDCEGTGSMFQVTTLLPPPKEKCNLKLTKEGLVDYKNDFFSKATYLTVSGQLEVENFACAMSDVYTFGPTFRAEVSHTSRHLAEFWMIEPEMCFADLFDDIECGENYLKFCLKYVLENNKSDLEFLEKSVEKGLVERLKNVVENEFKRLPYTEAIEILKEAVKKDKKLFIEKKELTPEEKEKLAQEKKAKAEAKKKAKEEKKKAKEAKKEGQAEEPKKEDKPKKEDENRNIYWGMDLASVHERYLTEHVFKKPVILYNYPKEIKSFYMKQNPDGKTVAAADILVPKIGEIIGGSQREEDYDKLVHRMEELGMEKESMEWYLNLRRFGGCIHSGFGMGFERLLIYLTGVENIRDVIPYPRTPNNCEY